MTRDELMKKAAECDLGRVVGPLETLLDEEWESLHRFVDYCLRAEVEALRPDAERYRAWRREFVGASIGSISALLAYASTPDDVDAAIDAAKGGAMPRERCPHEHAVEDWRLNVAPREGGGNG